MNDSFYKRLAIDASERYRRILSWRGFPGEVVDGLVRWILQTSDEYKCGWRGAYFGFLTVIEMELLPEFFP